MKTTPTIASLFSNGLKQLSVGSNTVAYEDSFKEGSGAPPTRVIIALPGMGDYRQQYRFIAPKLVADGYRVIASDLRGLGDSSTGFTSYAAEDVASDVIAILDKEKITTPVVLLGNSFCAAVGVVVAANHPNRVAALISLSGFFRVMPADAYFRPLSYLLFNSLWGAASWTMYFKTLFKTPPSDMNEYVAFSHAHLSANSKRVAAIGGFARASKAGAWKAVSSTKCSVLLIMGGQDPDFQDPKAETEQVAAEFKEKRESAGIVETLIVDGAGHYPHVEKPEEVYAAISSFLKSV